LAEHLNLYIAGEWRPALDGARREIRCPADGQLVATAAEASTEDTHAAIAAARADHFARTIEPALARGRWVICDRFVDSSLAYQGGAGALGIEKVRELNGWAIGDGFPDRTLILVLDEGVDRARARDTDGSDRIGGRGADYHQRVDLAFRMIAAEEPERVRLIDASGAPDDITERLLDALKDLLP